MFNESVVLGGELLKAHHLGERLLVLPLHANDTIGRIRLIFGLFLLQQVLVVNFPCLIEVVLLPFEA